MQHLKTDILIIGGGLTGLTIAYLLKDQDLDIKVIEARNRIGGRINTVYGKTTASTEMGATWLGQKHQSLIRLLKSLNIGIYEQYMGDKVIYEAMSLSPAQVVNLPPNSDPSYRIKGGSFQLIQTLAAHLNTNQIHTNQVVQSIEQKDTIFNVNTVDTHYEAKIVVSTLPPYLLAKTVEIKPILPDTLKSVMMNTHTWMGESIKFGLTYQTPFWRAKNTSGTLVSNVGPIPEMYDHSNFEANLYGLKGFLNGSFFSVSLEKRKELILNQLQKYYGGQVKDYLTYEETVWRNEPFTFSPYETHLLPHQNNGHQEYHQSFLDSRFFVAGSETGKAHPGYMDGAISSANFVSKAILAMLPLS